LGRRADGACLRAAPAQPLRGSPEFEMKQLRDLVIAERAARRLFAAHVQSSLGTGAAYVALLVLAYERFHSPLAVSAILLCEFLPSLLLGAVLGALADRHSRRAILVTADIVRAAAFAGMALVGSFWATVALAAGAGVGQAAFQPAVMASLPSLVSEERLPSATGVYGAIQELGYTAGPVFAAAAFVFVDAPGVLLANAVTFALSAALLATLKIRPLEDAAGDDSAGDQSLAQSIRNGARALRDNKAAWTVVLSSTAFVCFLGAVNVAELLLVRTTLGGGPGAYALVVATMGIGITGGSLLAGRAGDTGAGRRLYLAGIALCAAGMAACALAPAVAVALVAFLAMGVGNGLALVSENVLLQQVIPADLKGRVFGLKGALISAAFLVAYFGGALLLEAVGPRATFALIAAGSAIVWTVARIALATPTSAQEDPGRPDLGPAGPLPSSR
jgi:MFS family permease